MDEKDTVELNAPADMFDQVALSDTEDAEQVELLEFVDVTEQANTLEVSTLAESTELADKEPFVSAENLTAYHGKLIDGLNNGQMLAKIPYAEHVGTFFNQRDFANLTQATSTILSDGALKLDYTYHYLTNGVSKDQAIPLESTGLFDGMEINVQSIVQEPSSDGFYRYIIWYFMGESWDPSTWFSAVCFGSEYYYNETTQNIPRQVIKEGLNTLHIPAEAKYIRPWCLCAKVAPSASEVVSLSQGNAYGPTFSITALYNMSTDLALSTSIGGTGVSLPAPKRDSVVIMDMNSTSMSLAPMSDYNNKSLIIDLNGAPLGTRSLNTTIMQELNGKTTYYQVKIATSITADNALTLSYAYTLGSNPSTRVFSIETLGLVDGMEINVQSFTQNPVTNNVSGKSNYRYAFWVFLPSADYNLSDALGIVCFRSEYYTTETKDIPRQVIKEGINVLNVPSKATHVAIFAPNSGSVPQLDNAFELSSASSASTSFGMTATYTTKDTIKVATTAGGTGASLSVPAEDSVVTMAANSSAMALTPKADLITYYPLADIDFIV